MNIIDLKTNKWLDEDDYSAHFSTVLTAIPYLQDESGNNRSLGSIMSQKENFNNAEPIMLLNISGFDFVDEIRVMAVKGCYEECIDKNGNCVYVIYDTREPFGLKNGEKTIFFKGENRTTWVTSNRTEFEVLLSHLQAES